MSVYTRAMVRAAANVVLRPTFFDDPPPGDARAVSQRLTEEGVRGKEKVAGGPRTEEGGANPVNELIDQLARLSITDVAYAHVYAQITRLQPAYASVIVAPQVAAFIPRSTPQYAPGTSAAPNVSQWSEGRCYYCGEEGCRVSRCQWLAKDEAAGWVKRENNYTVYKDGSRLQ